MKNKLNFVKSHITNLQEQQQGKQKHKEKETANSNPFLLHPLATQPKNIHALAKITYRHMKFISRISPKTTDLGERQKGQTKKQSTFQHFNLFATLYS